MTGCAGFIGYHVCRLLLESNETVEGVDNLDDAYDVRLKEWRLRQLSIWPNFRFSEFDISDHRAVRPLFATDSVGGPSQISAVINLGARAGVRSSLDDPWAYYQTNAIGTLNLLELCREFEVKKFVLASSSSVYGAETSRPFVEEGHTSRPLSPYGASKKAAETLVYSYHYLYGIDATLLRYFTVYGPAGRPDMGPFIFIRAISEGAPITVFGMESKSATSPTSMTWREEPSMLSGPSVTKSSTWAATASGADTLHRNHRGVPGKESTDRIRARALGRRKGHLGRHSSCRKIAGLAPKDLNRRGYQADSSVVHGQQGVGERN